MGVVKDFKENMYIEVGPCYMCDRKTINIILKPDEKYSYVYSDELECLDDSVNEYQITCLNCGIMNTVKKKDYEGKYIPVNTELNENVGFRGCQKTSQLINSEILPTELHFLLSMFDVAELEDVWTFVIPTKDDAIAFLGVSKIFNRENFFKCFLSTNYDNIYEADIIKMFNYLLNQFDDSHSGYLKNILMIKELNEELNEHGKLAYNTISKYNYGWYFGRK